MNLFKHKPYDTKHKCTIISNLDKILLFKYLDTGELVYPVFDGKLEYDEEKEAYKITKHKYTVFYKGISTTKVGQKVKENEPIGLTTVISLTGLYQVKGFYFWIEKDGCKLDPIPFILGVDNTLKERKKPQNSKRTKTTKDGVIRKEDNNGK